MSLLMIHIWRFTPWSILRLQKPVSEFTYIAASSSLSSTIGCRVLTPRRINYIIQQMFLNCDTIAIGYTSYRHKVIWSQIWMNRFMSPRASESALSYTHRLWNCLTVPAYNRSLNMTILYWTKIYRYLRLSCCTIYWMESIPCRLGYMNLKSCSPQTDKVWSKYGVLCISPFRWPGSNISIIGYTCISYMTPHNSSWHCGRLLTIPHLFRNEPFKHELVVICLPTGNKVSQQ